MGLAGDSPLQKAQSLWRLRQARLAYAKDRRHVPWDESSGTRQLRLFLMRAAQPVRTGTSEGDAWRTDLPEGATDPRRRRPQARARRVRRGAEPTGVTIVGGDDGGARLAVAEGVVLRKACIGETTKQSRDNGGGGDA